MKPSEVDLFGKSQGVIDLHAQITNGAFELGVSQQELDGALNGWAAFAAAEWAPKIEALDEWQVIRLLALSGLGIALLSLRWLPRNPEGETSK